MCKFVQTVFFVTCRRTKVLNNVTFLAGYVVNKGHIYELSRILHYFKEKGVFTS